MAFRCFWIEPVGRAEQSVGVFCSQCGDYTHRELGEVRYATYEDYDGLTWEQMEWPTHCGACGHEFDLNGEDHRSSGLKPIYRSEDGREGQIRDFGVGAMWDADWYTRKGPDGRALTVRLPGDYDWMIDSQASNCDQKDREHYCWVRTGEPPNVTVNKGQPGESCNAGAGSIWVDMPDGWHGFLTRGWLHEPGEAVPA